MPLIKCTECGNMISDKASKCPKCGMPTGLVKQNQDETTQLQHHVRVSPEVGEDSSHRNGLYIIIALLAVAALGIGGFILWKSGEKSTKEDSQKEEPDPVIQNLVDNMVDVEGGTFTMGATPEQGVADSDERPTHQVTLSSFSIGRYEVTQEEWEAVMGTNPASFKGDKCPVEFVSWNDCQTFIKKLNKMTGMEFRLPTEAEWEFAARGGNKSKSYKFAGGNTLNTQGWYVGNSGNKTNEVGKKFPNELGLYDMTGNLWEWCADWYGAYSDSSQKNPTGPQSGFTRVLRGGGWNGGDKNCRISNRDGRAPDYSSDRLGLRLVMDI